MSGGGLGIVFGVLMNLTTVIVPINLMTKIHN